MQLCLSYQRRSFQEDLLFYFIKLNSKLDSENNSFDHFYRIRILISFHQRRPFCGISGLINKGWMTAIWDTVSGARFYVQHCRSIPVPRLGAP